MVLWMMGLMVASGAPPFTDPVAKAAVAALEKQAVDWNRGDLDAFCAIYAEDAIFLSPSGVRRGKAEVLAGYKKKYTSKEIMGALSFEFLDARVAEGGKAVTVAARWMLHRAPAAGGDASGFTLLSLQLKGGSWTIVQDASM